MNLLTGNFKFYIYLVIFLAFTLLGQLLLKYGAMDLKNTSEKNIFNFRNIIFILTNYKIILGILSWILSTFLWIIILSQVKLSFAYCFVSINYILIPLLSIWLFKEKTSNLHIIGFTIIFTGVLVTLYAGNK